MRRVFPVHTTLPWALYIDPAHRPASYLHHATFQPTFLYELVFDLALAGALVWLGHHRPIRTPGLFALYVAGYSAFRLFEESLRIDPAQHLLGLRLNMYVAGALTLAGLTWFTLQHRGAASPPRKSPAVDTALPLTSRQDGYAEPTGLTALLSGRRRRPDSTATPRTKPASQLLSCRR